MIGRAALDIQSHARHQHSRANANQGLSTRIPLGFKILDQKSLGVHMGCSYIVSRILQSWTFTYFATMISSLLIGLFTYFRVSKLRHFVIMLPISLVIVSLATITKGTVLVYFCAALEKGCANQCFHREHDL